MANETTGGLIRQLKGRSSTFTANGTTTVVVANKNVMLDSLIAITLRTAGGTVGNPYVVAKNPGVGFSIVSQTGDTSTYTYAVI
jgi:hypothetical protein